ncbi:hypothetical protein B0H13DRAFT_1597909 [Mycena leptocephala]|nr:hypothetical protein B0H13DRAFT_1597909 [Mycena leptocephala]
MVSDTQITQLLSKSTSYTPNFTAEHTVILPHDIESVFDKLAHGETMEPSVRLSDLCAMFRLTTRDCVALKGNEELGQVRCRGLPPVPGAGENDENDNERVLPRQFFVLQEAVPLLFGLYTHTVTIAGCLTSDLARRAVLYESSATGGILISKLRTFEELAPSAEGGGGPRTKVFERIEGRAPVLLRGTVEKETRRAHAAHMELFQTLFS